MADGFAIPQFKYSHQAGAVAATVIKPQPGVLRAVVLNTVGATPGTITISDSATGAATPVIAIIADTASQTPATLIFDINFLNGLTYTNAGGTTADVTLSYI